MLVEIDGRLGGRDADPADRDHRLACHLDQQRRLSAQADVILFGDRRGQNRSDRRVHRVAAPLQHAEAGLHFEVVRGCHHLSRAPHRRKHRLRLRKRGERAEDQQRREGPTRETHRNILSFSLSIRYFRSNS